MAYAERQNGPLVSGSPSMRAEFFDLMAEFTHFGLWYAIVIGLAIGSFLNVVIHRVPKALFTRHVEDGGAAKTASPWLSVIYPASTTPCCHQAIAWHDNIPVLSWLLLRGRCRHCQQPISLRYPMVECMTSIAIVWAFMHFGLSWIALWYCLLLAILIALFFIDLDTCYLPDDLTYSALWLGLLGSALGILPLLPANAILGACAGYALSWSVNAAYWLLRRRDGFRGGDFKLMATLGAWLGVSAILPILAVASARALLGVVALMLVRREQFSWGGRLPCGPFLIAAGVFIAL